MEFHLEDNHFFRRCFEGNPKGEERKYIFKFCKLDINMDKNITCNLYSRHRETEDGSDHIDEIGTLQLFDFKIQPAQTLDVADLMYHRHRSIHCIIVHVD